MSALAAILTLLLLAAVVVVISGPLRRSRRRAAEPDAERSALEAAREAKYREIRDAELDHQTGKLSAEDYAALSRGLRAEAVQILDRLAVLGEARAAVRERTPERQGALEGGDSPDGERSS